ncbi:hypothetical protein [Caballeronia calidae]|uniref:hypothetical protein n=1 Tax=Caballeronia calidae TaxID=1777139 RepID=UPI000B0DFCF2|nr:hypothetical protein [Caballeronia calidae]
MDKVMGQVEKNAIEAAAIARVAEAARDVQAASIALETHFKQEGADAPTLHLARLAAAMSELQRARDEFDALLASKRSP